MFLKFVESEVITDDIQFDDSTELSKEDEEIEVNYSDDDSEGLIFKGDDNTKRTTNVIIREYYSGCVNINSDVDKLTTNLSVISNESCLTVYRFAAFEIVYDIVFKNGSIGQTTVDLNLQDSERTIDTITVTLTGIVKDGYLKGAHFQSIIIYPVINDSNCLAEPGITELQSNSASVAFILLVKPSDDSNDLISGRTPKLPEAFDCFGNASINYKPGLININQYFF